VHFNVTSQTYLLTNWGAASLSWSLINTSSWLNASAISGTLAPNSGSSNVTISLPSATTNLGIGTYIANIWFSNVTTHVAQNRQFTLQVVPPLQITPSNWFRGQRPGRWTIQCDIAKLRPDQRGDNIIGLEHHQYFVLAQLSPDKRRGSTRRILKPPPQA